MHSISTVRIYLTGVSTEAIAQTITLAQTSCADSAQSIKGSWTRKDDTLNHDSPASLCDEDDDTGEESLDSTKVSSTTQLVQYLKSAQSERHKVTGTTYYLRSTAVQSREE